jgi:molecular chaperone DnaK
MTDITLKSLLPSRIGNNDISNTTFIGVDFGTSTTVVSIAHLDQSSGLFATKAIPIKQALENGQTQTSEKVPTVIAFLRVLGQNRFIYGQGAADLKHNYNFKLGKNIWYSFKTQLGTDVGALYYDCEIENEKNKIRNPKDALQLFLGFINAKVQSYIQENKCPTNTQYAVSIPASFEANQRKELIDALALNGITINKQSLIDEPNAAFLSYVEQSFSEKTPLKVPEQRNINVLVFDFGAGTCDVSILEIGNGLKGLYSKNVAISKYYEIGGDDIDRYLVLDCLFPQFAQQNNLKISDFRKGEIKKDILPKLLKSAEQLKLMICDKVGLLMQDNILSTQAITRNNESLGYDIEIEIPRLGKLKLTKPQISNEQFRNVMSVFCNSSNSTLKNESLKLFETIFVKKFENIFSPIKSALNKGKLKEDDIDYVLFIGGSSKNPYIRSTIKEYFNESQIIVPSDLQTHVSKGAAIHSLIFNGLNKNLIQPITSEPILLLTKQGTLTLLTSGTEVPSEIHKIEDLEIAKEKQEIIELPIFIGNMNKMLFNFKWYVPEGKYYPIGTPVKVIAEINADKILNIRAFIKDQEMQCEPLYPLSSGDLTTEQRAVLVAEKKFNLDAERNGGKPTKDGFRNLYKAYKLAGMQLQAAQSLEEMNDIYPDNSNLNEIAVGFANGGDKVKSLEYSEKAFDANPSNSVLASNLALEYKSTNKEKYFQMLDKAIELNSNNAVALFEKGRHLKMSQNDIGRKLIEQAFNIYKEKFDNNQLNESEYSWFESCARELGKIDLAQLIQESKPRHKGTSLWNEENLTRTNNNEGLIKF